MQKTILPSSDEAGEKFVSYDQYIVDIAVQLGRELARHFEVVAEATEDPDEKKLMALNARRAYSSIDRLLRIEVPS